MIKSTIWLFRSSINSHKIWPLNNENKKKQKISLQKKQKFAPFWGIVCPIVKKYCEDKRLILGNKLMKFFKDNDNNDNHHNYYL